MPPWTFAWICCPQLPKNGMHNTSFCRVRFIALFTFVPPFFVLELNQQCASKLGGVKKLRLRKVHISGCFDFLRCVCSLRIAVRDPFKLIKSLTSQIPLVSPLAFTMPIVFGSSHTWLFQTCFFLQFLRGGALLHSFAYLRLRSFACFCDRTRLERLRSGTSEVCELVIKTFQNVSFCRGAILRASQRSKALLSLDGSGDQARRLRFKSKRGLCEQRCLSASSSERNPKPPKSPIPQKRFAQCTKD